MLEQCHLDRDNETRSGSLAGNISASVGASDAMRDLLLPVIYEALDKMTGNDKKDMVWEPLDLWINFQKKHEFNPFHSHSGALSFVLWMKIPYKYEDECNTPNTQNLGNQPCSGAFSFYYTSVLGSVSHYDYLLDPSLEATLLVYPASLSHQVYPFYTSDD